MNHSLRIAVADDEPDMRDFFERMLPRSGHRVVCVAENGRQLIECCRETQPDVVITDIKMPDIDGIEAGSQICRERPTPVILVSAYHDPELIDRAEADHVMAYLVKPISQADLQPAIALAMRRFEEMQALRREADHLKQALVDRKIIEQAKGVLMTVTGVSEKDAFRRLQELAANKNQKLIDAAHTVLCSEKTLRPAEGTTTHLA
jgi:AmiR/NasT family two-component response regulator